jgi:transcriptional regulator with XRE-family HTH domain
LGRAPIDVLVGQRLATLRTARAVTQDQLGAMLGITGNQIADYESGAVRISPTHLIQICQFFQVPVQTLFPNLDPD